MTIKTLVENFSVTNLKDFFRAEITTFKPDDDNYEYLFNENSDITNNYKDIVKIGEANLINSDDIFVITANTLTPLSDRIGKKRQYEIAKKILKEENKDAAFFIFYDEDGNFRFSLIRVNFLGAKRDFTDFKRYTYFVSQKQTNKTFINQISKGDFNSLDSIQEAFSVEPITKQFYEKLQRWYFWAITKVEFPKDAEQETNGREVAIIRLITRLMFIWFMKVRELIPTELFDEENIHNVLLKDFSAEESTYYKAILQNLFFATLNTKQNERKFRSEIRGIKGYNPDFGNPNVFRYHKLFNDSEELEKLFSKIPFLNGGLFECLDYKTKDKSERKYIDGFTSTIEHQPKVPNFLFFSKIEKVDISSFFGQENKTYEVEGLINLLSNYNFTIDENEPDDVEVALDPELLGSIFENLLASYNPETATTARKATGSFYTPREIVNYMTNESLKQYFRQGIGSILLSNNLQKEKEEEYAIEDSFLDPNSEIIIKQGILPHWTQENSWYFITFRLADSIPMEKVEQLKRDRKIWFEKKKKKDGEEYSKEDLKEYYYLFSERVEKWLNAGYGKCVLKDKLNAEIVANAIKHFENKRYELDEWVVMPNHVHVLVKPLENYSISDITHSWKSFSANEINKNINLSGQLWMHESYDHIVRNEKAFRAIKNYIRQNPQKAGIVIAPNASSFREEETQKEASSFQEHEQITKQNPKQDALGTLFDSSSENPFDEQTTKQIIDLINNLRVVDPAVGSGAFPMAMLNKLVFILGKLDPENKHWKQSQIDGVKKSVSDSVVQRKLIEQIERQFKEKNADYGRKLYLIEKCIYGVDIQQIAVEIAKLRFFISLLVDEKIDWNKPENNYGIEPLPNLDFKLMQGNSLISTYAGIDFNDKKEVQTENLLFDADETYKELIKEFEELKHQYQNEADNITKKELRDKIDKAIIKLFEEKISEHFPELKRIEENAKQFPKEEQRKKYISEEKQKLTKRLGFDIEQVEKDLTAYTEGRKAKDFFLWNVYFAEVFSEKGGFDVVIGNPPYVEHKKLKHIAKRLKPNYEVYTGSSDLSVYFFEKGFNLLKLNGTLSYISTNKFFNTGYGKTLRRYLLTKKINQIINFEQVEVFEGVLVSSVVFISENKTQNKNGQFKFVEFKKEKNWKSTFDEKLCEREKQFHQSIFDDSEWVFLNSNEDSLKKKIERNGKIVQEIEGIEIKRGVTTGFDLAFIIDTETKILLDSVDIIKPLLLGKDIKKYLTNFNNNFLINSHNGRRGKNDRIILKRDYSKVYDYLIKFNKENSNKVKIRTDQGEDWTNLRNCAFLDLFDKEKIVWPLTADKWAFALDKDKHYLTSGGFFMVSSKYSLKVILAILNSKLMEYYFSFIGVMTAGGAYTLKKATIECLPIRFPKNNKPFEKLVNKIITKKENGEDTTAEEQEIDIMVYKLYDLTYEEVKIVDSAFSLTKEEYENHS